MFWGRCGSLSGTPLPIRHRRTEDEPKRKRSEMSTVVHLSYIWVLLLEYVHERHQAALLVRHYDLVDIV